MKKLLFVMLATSLVISTANAAVLHYDPSQLKQFEALGICVDCNLSGASITGEHQQANIAQTNFSDATITDADFTESNFANINGIHGLFHGNFSGSSFVQATLLHADFTQANLTYVDFTGANVLGIDLAYANLYGAKITAEQLAGAMDLCRAVLPDGSVGRC